VPLKENLGYSIRLGFLLVSIILLFPYPGEGQLCTGSFGDPVVKLTFDKTTTIGSSSYVPPSAYTYTTTSCPNDGYYTITNYTTECFNSSWLTVSADHTGGGSFMLVNASYQPGDFFLSTVTDLCPNTTYEFSAWVLNVMKPFFPSIRPNLTFRIEKPDGTVLASFDSGDVPVSGTPTWLPYGFLFTTPGDNARIVLRLRNNAPGGQGNDLAIDDIAFRPCGAKITAAIQNSATDTIDVCEGNTNAYTFFGNASSQYQSPVYHWQLSMDAGITWNDIPGATSTSFIRMPTTAPGKYWYRLSVVDASVAGITSCRIASNFLIINVHPFPVANAGPDRVYVKGYPVTLSSEATGEDISFSWNPMAYMVDATLIQPTVSPPTDITYILSVESAFHCTSKDSVHVRAVDGIFVPTAFTPNGDGKNDSWRIPFLDVGLGADVKVFSRWGQLVYHVSSAAVSWDGKLNGQPQATGTYVYLITFKDGKLPELKGTFTLIR
jgi:gliding motility-associated-like protein